MSRGEVSHMLALVLLLFGVVTSKTIDPEGVMASDYQSGSIGGNVTKSLGDCFIRKEDKVFRNNYKIDNIGVNIVYHYVILTKDVETDSSSKALASKIVDIAQTFIPNLSSSDVSNEVDVIINTLKIHQEFIQRNYLPKALVEAERKVI
ncbi:9702_t:CDS:2 [Ambispora gerdemannii]|uniref:9702_t:CDS:1 n=1 Tax=Ambispora gerdemannii TaxID=144530 RepID=A0A9N9AEJ9_9GLOM|nr:9702_t:CDS:2 [Ambispora gerdemannii]